MHQAIVELLATSKAQEIAPVPPRVDMYETYHFTEATNKKLAEAAWVLHGLGYKARQFVEEEAVTDHGLEGGLDHSRGPDVDYYISVRTLEEANEVTAIEAATFRKKSVTPESESDNQETGIRSLPGIQLSWDHISPEGREEILSVDEAKLKEITALATGKKYLTADSKSGSEIDGEANPLAVYYLIRSTIQEALGNDEVWFFSIVSETYDSLSENFGDSAVRQIGTPFELKDPLVKAGIKLVPVITHVDSFIRDIYDAYEAETDPILKRKQLTSFVFFSEGLNENKLDRDLLEKREEILASSRKQAS